jgi:hypothetical protein
MPNMRLMAFTATAALVMLALLAYFKWVTIIPTDFGTAAIHSSNPPITYIPFTFGWSMLLQTLKGYQLAGWSNIVIVDNTWDGYAVSQLEILQKEYGVMDVTPTPVHLRFSQLQAFLDHLARTANLPYYFWSHTDVILLPFTTTAYRQATQCVEKGTRNGTLGVMYFEYDLLSAVTDIAGLVAPWDPAMPQYGSDCDRYKRLRLGGLETRDCENQIGEVLHLRSLLSEAELEMLYKGEGTVKERADRIREIDGKREKYAWREAKGGESVTEMDRLAAEAERQGGEVYFEGKWGKNPPCELWDRQPKFEQPNIKTETTTT